MIKATNIQKETVKKDIVIKNIITFEAGKEFYAVKEKANKGQVFWNLYDTTTCERILRLRNDEYETYFIC